MDNQTNNSRTESLLSKNKTTTLASEESENNFKPQEKHNKNKEGNKFAMRSLVQHAEQIMIAQQQAKEY